MRCSVPYRFAATAFSYKQATLRPVSHTISNRDPQLTNKYGGTVSCDFPKTMVAYYRKWAKVDLVVVSNCSSFALSFGADENARDNNIL